MAGRGENTAAPLATTTTTVHDVPDDPLELIFLRLSTSLHIVRAACACKRWRRVIAGGGFLARFRSLHARRVVAGHYRVDERKHGSRPPGCNPIFSLSASVDTAGMWPQHFSLCFLPDSRGGRGWDLADSRDGVLLLTRCPGFRNNDYRPSLVVCDPTTRCCSRVINHPSFLGNWSCFGAFLLDGDGGGISPSNFRIIVTACDQGAVTTSVFTSADDDWRIGGIPYDAPSGGFFFLAGNTQDAVYWTGRDSDTGRSEVLVLDKRTQEFSSSLFPEQLPYRCDPQLRAVCCNDGAVRIALLYRNELRTFRRWNNLGRDAWAEERRIPLQPSIRALQGASKLPLPRKILAVVEGSVVLGTAGGSGIISVDLSIMKFRRMSDGDKYCNGPAYEYQLPWPPTIRACLA
ncbi:hypothetical protein VPH35_068847 [Triticum aestivum]